MSDLISPANFDFFARFLLAGYIIIYVRSLFISAQRPKPAEVIFHSVVLSLINQLLFLAGAGLLGSVLPAGSLGIPPRGIFFVEVLVLPAALGVMLGRAWDGRWMRGLRRLTMPNIHPAQRAYDFAFARLPGPGFVILSYQDGTQVHGYFGEASLAATDDQRSDIFLERLYSVENGTWTETVPPRSALLMLSGLRSIEFIPEGAPDE